MKITHKILNIPPYISTAWENIKLLAMDGNNLVVILQNESRVIIPNIDKNLLAAIFDAHAKAIEEKNKLKKIDFTFGLPLNKEALGGFELLPQALQHNPEQSNLPNLPDEVLSKIALISKTIGFDNPNALPKPEPHCNCIYCQLAKALGNQKLIEEELGEEEKISEEDLRFRTWDIEQTAQNQYTVANPFNKEEKYFVFLGDPIGCTCGSNKCEHIQAVLKS
ncbi:MAG: hypothetical protein WC371_00495 [Parachlamydiales bacterium]|jgi:hypothetical protein